VGDRNHQFPCEQHRVNFCVGVIPICIECRPFVENKNFAKIILSIIFWF